MLKGFSLGLFPVRTFGFLLMMFIIKLEFILFNLILIFALLNNIKQNILISINLVYFFIPIPFPLFCSVLSKPLIFTLFLDYTYSITLDKTHLVPSSPPYRLYYILPTIPPFFPPPLQEHVSLPPYFSHLSSSLSFSYRLSDIIYVMNHISEFLYYRAFLKVYEILNTSFPFLFIILFKLFMFTNISLSTFLLRTYFSFLCADLNITPL